MPSTFGEWLRETRLRQRLPDGRPWRQEDFLERLEAELGWRLTRSNYSKYENDKLHPRPETRARFEAFWRRYGVAPPDLRPPEPEPTIEQLLVAAIYRHAEAIASQAEQMARQAAALDRQTEALERLLAQIGELVSQRRDAA